MDRLLEGKYITATNYELIPLLKHMGYCHMVYLKVGFYLDFWEEIVREENVKFVVGNYKKRKL